GEPVEIGFNVNYLLDALGAVAHSRINMELKDGNSSALIKSPESSEALYVVMPMRL
ncbi:MAG: DNA polymerase III subunit beta, partial [Gammaproteobacteria bacterium]